MLEQLAYAIDAINYWQIEYGLVGTVEEATWFEVTLHNHTTGLQADVTDDSFGNYHWNNTPHGPWVTCTERAPCPGCP